MYLFLYTKSSSQSFGDEQTRCRTKTYHTLDSHPPHVKISQYCCCVLLYSVFGIHRVFWILRWQTEKCLFQTTRGEIYYPHEMMRGKVNITMYSDLLVTSTTVVQTMDDSSSFTNGLYVYFRNLIFRFLDYYWLQIVLSLTETRTRKFPISTIKTMDFALKGLFMRNGLITNSRLYNYRLNKSSI